MTRQFAWTTAALTGIIGLLVGIILSTPRVPADAATRVANAAVTGPAAAPERASQVAPAASTPSISFADIAARVNRRSV